MLKEELALKIKRQLGFPYIKIELTNDHLNDAIDEAYEKWVEWTIGNSTSEHYFTIPLSAGQSEYSLPDYVYNIISYKSENNVFGGINTLFTLDNYLYQSGYFNPSQNAGDMLSYHAVLDYIEMIDRYTPDKYDYKYYRKHNKLILNPAPELKEVKIINNEEWNFGGYLLLNAYVYEGGFLSNWNKKEFIESIYDESWVLKYATARAKVILGYIRRKFEGFSSIGNTGISLDGSSLISEGNEEMEKLSEELDEKYSYDGYGIVIGSI